ncbi:hypothetical protein BD408DRAFT_252845 [Parasitella parasitica]|nr:hypothetical protein BD408DRAFT_252845 [Parasitella parasitica]
MQPILPANQRKGCLIKRESSSDSEQVPEPTFLSVERLVCTEQSGPSVQKARHGRLKKTHVETIPLEGSQSEATIVAPSATIHTNTGASQQVDEVVLTLQDILKNKWPSTELAYRMPLAVWKKYCQSLELDRFSEDTLHPYTVGPPAKVAAFF